MNHLIAQPDFRVEAVVTQPDRPRGRGHQVTSSAVKDAALDAGIAVYQPEKIKSESGQNFFKRVAPDAVVIIAYGQIISQTLLDIPRLGWINLHGSLLPKYRGAAPINWALVNGETRTGVTSVQVNAGLDTGPILLKYETEIGADETAPQLAARLAEAGAPLIAETLRKLDRGEATPEPQDDSRATLAPLLKKENGRIDWSQPAQAIYNRIRGLQPWPGAFTTFCGKNCHIWGRPAVDTIRTQSPALPGAVIVSAGELAVACGEDTALHIEFTQLEGRKRVTAREFASGARIVPTDRFGT
jgi:methionyl-tRNA formyltransferase